MTYIVMEIQAPKEGTAVTLVTAHIAQKSIDRA